MKLSCIDTSYQSVATGMLQSVCSAIRGSLNDLIENIDNPIINVAFITYDETIRFYQLRVFFSLLSLYLGRSYAKANDL